MTLVSEAVDGKALALGTVIAVIMGSLFAYAGGKPLVVTFVPGLIVSWGILLWLHLRQQPIPSGASLYPVYYGALAWQFVHFFEEFVTGFRVGFFPLYGHGVVSNDLFVGINLFSYFMFAVAFILAFRFRLRFFLLPTYFFIIYGVLGNAIAHVWWAVLAKGYFPGFFTALAYWIIGPVLLAHFLGTRKRAAVVIVSFAIILIPAITFTRDQPMSPGCRGFHSLLCYEQEQDPN